MSTEEIRKQLLEKANGLPLCPGVYLMRDGQGKIIYVGKSRKLKNRVSQYFHNSEKTFKTARMVEKIAAFDYFICDTEIEALALENTLIKQHTPKYNVRLKDAKSYPYVKITQEPYPRLVFTRRRLSDKGQYFGPYSGVSVAGAVLRGVSRLLRLPTCKRQFPRDIGKERPCLYYQMGQCCGVCTGKVSEQEYAPLVRRAAEILRGNTAAVRREIGAEMTRAAEKEQFEKAAVLRDTLYALEKLSQKQKVVAAPDTAEDVFGFYRDDYAAAMAIFYVRDGALIDKQETVFSPEELIEEKEALVSFLYDHYRRRSDLPPRVLLSFSLGEEDKAVLEASLTALAGHRVDVHTPERGELRTLCELAATNAKEKIEKEKNADKEADDVLVRLGALLQLETVPDRIESYDISNIGKEHKTCGMVVLTGGKFNKNDYRLFRIRDVAGTDDYASMREALSRRFDHLTDAGGSFAAVPDLILLDGGKTHVAAIRALAKERGITVPIFGMVKDDYHKTRALCTDTEEISVAKDKAVYTLLYRLQEEVHRFSIRRMSEAKNRTVRRSSLENIPGVGAAKAKAILAYFGGLAAVRRADVNALCKAPGVGPSLAETIYRHFHGEEKQP